MASEHLLLKLNPVIAKPFVKWVGGKRKVIPELLSSLPTTFDYYYEPFVGGGALFFHLRSLNVLEDHKITLADINLRLIRTYCAIRDDVEGVIVRLQQHANHHCRDYFYAVRDADVDTYENDADVAAWFIYLNKTAFNGLYRVNKKNRFNAPMGKYKNPTICDAENLRNCHDALQNVEILHQSFTAAENAQSGSLVYFDPPYVPVSATSSFTSYTTEGFGMTQHIQLRDVALSLRNRGVHVMVSNSDHEIVRGLYAGFDIRSIQVGRAINSKATGRGKVGEVIIT
jgi:DNA adenine methylase